jgi:hypothetical protein
MNEKIVAEIIPFRRSKQKKNRKRRGHKARKSASALLHFPAGGRDLAAAWSRVVSHD